MPRATGIFWKKSPAVLKAETIVVTNYHAFLRRETLELSKGGRALLQGPGPELRTKETEGQMLQCVMPGLMGMKRILALNDEAHHCYREKPAGEDEEGPLKGDDRKEAERNREAARVWISGLEAVQRKLGLQRVIDLSATPFFLRGSGYAEGTLFPWTASDFSLMDAIECGIVKLPRVPVADNIPGGEMPKFRNLWEHIRPKMPKRGRGKAGGLDVEARLRLRLRLLPRERVRRHDAGERAPGAVSQLRRAREPAPPSPHAAHRQRAARRRRGARQELPRRGRRRDRALPAGDRRPDG